MKLTRFQLIPAGASLLLLLAAPSFSQNAYSQSGSTQPEGTSAQTNSNMSRHHHKKTVDMAEVPQAAKDAAQKQLGTAPERAKELTNTSPQEYELSAKNGSGKNVKVDVFADGTLAKKGSSRNNSAG